MYILYIFLYIVLESQNFFNRVVDFYDKLNILFKSKKEQKLYLLSK